MSIRVRALDDEQSYTVVEVPAAETIRGRTHFVALSVDGEAEARIPASAIHPAGVARLLTGFGHASRDDHDGDGGFLSDNAAGCGRRRPRSSSPQASAALALAALLELPKSRRRGRDLDSEGGSALTPFDFARPRPCRCRRCPTTCSSTSRPSSSSRATTPRRRASASSASRCGSTRWCRSSLSTCCAARASAPCFTARRTSAACPACSGG